MLDDVVLGLVNLSRSHVYQRRISDALDAAQEANTIIQGFGVERMSMIAAGKTNREIANELVISVGTAKRHVHNILQKLGGSNRSQAIARARELGF